MNALYWSVVACGVWLLTHAFMGELYGGRRFHRYFLPIAVYVLVMVWHTLHPDSKMYVIATDAICTGFALMAIRGRYWLSVLSLGVTLCLMWKCVLVIYPFENWYHIPTVCALAVLATCSLFLFATSTHERVAATACAFVYLQILNQRILILGIDELCSLFWITLVIYLLSDRLSMLVAPRLSMTVRMRA